jgi:tetratricopeptide (TPR) repeat protein
VAKTKTFVESRDAAKAALDQMQVSRATVGILQSRLDRIKDPKNRAEIEQKVAQAEQAVEENRARALVLYRRAIELADASVDINELNSVRYYLSFLYYEMDQPFHAAVLSEFVARRYPDGTAARSCAKVAMASYWRVYREAGPSGNENHIRPIIDLADLIVKKWPGQPEAEDALLALVNFMVQKGDLQQAEDYLNRLPETSPRRGEAELALGQAMWRSYLEGVSELAAQDTTSQGAPDRFALEEIKGRAELALSHGIQRTRHAQPTETLLRSVLSLAQIYVEEGKPMEALQLLYDPEIGAKTLVDADHQVTRIPGFADETYKAAIRANVISVPEAPNHRAAIDDAIVALNASQDRIGNTPAGRQRLLAIYVGLAKDLERQMVIATPAARQTMGPVQVSPRTARPPRRRRPPTRSPPGCRWCSPP